MLTTERSPSSRTPASAIIYDNMTATVDVTIFDGERAWEVRQELWSHGAEQCGEVFYSLPPTLLEMALSCLF